MHKIHDTDLFGIFSRRSSSSYGILLHTYRLPFILSIDWYTVLRFGQILVLYLAKSFCCWFCIHRKIRRSNMRGSFSFYSFIHENPLIDIFKSALILSATPFSLVKWQECEMEPSIITKGRYKYVHDVKKGSPEAIDVHHIIFAGNSADCLTFFPYVLFAITCFVIFLFLQVYFIFMAHRKIVIAAIWYDGVMRLWLYSQINPSSMCVSRVFCFHTCLCISQGS